MIAPVTLFFLVVGGLLTYGDILLRFGARLWSQDHYQFFPIFLAGVAALVIDRARTEGEWNSRKWRVGPISFGLFLFTIIGAVGLRSPLLGFCSVFLAGYSLLCGFPLARRAWSLLLILVPPPMGFDTEIVHQLQMWSSTGASRILDYLHVAHVMNGNVVQLADRKLFVEEACSGLGSVYLVAGATLFWLVYSRERLSRGILLFASSFWWSMVSNVVRIVLIAASHQWLNIDLATGLAHQVLGVLTMLLALAGTASTAMLLKFFMSSISDERLKPDKSIALTPIALWNVATTTNRSLVYRPRVPLIKFDVSRNVLLNTFAFILMLCGLVYWTQPSIAGITKNARERSLKAFATKSGVETSSVSAESAEP